MRPVALLLLLLAAPAGAEPAPGEPVEIVAPGPWTITFADGSGNVTRVTRLPEEQVVRWRFAPVTPETSSSGTYSGGAPAEGDLDAPRTLELWARVRALTGDPSVRAPTRQMGTGSLQVTTAAGLETVLLTSDAAAELAALLARWR